MSPREKHSPPGGEGRSQPISHTTLCQTQPLRQSSKQQLSYHYLSDASSKTPDSSTKFFSMSRASSASLRRGSAPKGSSSHSSRQFGIDTHYSGNH